VFLQLVLNRPRLKAFDHFNVVLIPAFSNVLFTASLLCGKTRDSGARRHEPDARDGPEAKCSPEAIFAYKFPLRLIIKLAGVRFLTRNNKNITFGA